MKELIEVRMLKEGGYVIIDDVPCTIVNITISKPGKHGAAKARMDGIGVFDSQKRTAVQPVTSKMYVPIIVRRSGQVLSVSDDTAQIMDMEDYSIIELKIPENMKERVEPGKELSFLHYEGKYKIV
ncbi:MAG: translation initiation factor IF-5A [Methanophagales archaeon]|nr:translation initiation factor IF-5A [Methanophagales archaeon]